ncbi:MAG: DUF1552 domain-containing protein [Planctomycetota bacterium]|nr:DUF1552 domain-containing protein [Planctomycetota bacterium]
MSERTISRRTVLRGLGTAMALPFLECMSPAALLAGPARGAAGLARGAAEAASPPRRLAFIFVPNGVNVPEWMPRGDGRRFELSPTLAPLGRVKDDILVLSGLTHDKGRANGDGAGDHARSASVFLTGCQPVKTHGAEIRVGVSIDQIAAQAVGDRTRFPSLELGCEGGGNSGNCDSGYSCAYSGNISWASPTTPMAQEIDPRRVFDRLFSGAEGQRRAEGQRLAEGRRRAEGERRQARRRASILDFVLDDARRLDRRLGRTDRRKLHEYFTSVREIEKRLGKASSVASTAEIEAPEGLPEAAGRRLDYQEHLRLMADLMVLAFQSDSTRVATFMFARAGSNRNYRPIGVPDGHHNLSHHQGRPDNLEKIARINRFHVEQFAYLVERLKSIEEGDGTLLDQCMIVYGSGLSDGNRHNNENLPVVLAGRGGGTLDTGRHVRYEYETPMTNLFLSLLDRMDVSVEHFGDSSGRLRYLTT